jgi:DNA-binding PadR family transcriptional regulator
MNFNESERVAMEILSRSAGKKLYGLEIVALSENRLKRGTVHITLSRLEDHDLVKSEDEAIPKGSLARRLYEVTETGHKAYKEWCTDQAGKSEAFRSLSSLGAITSGG